MNRLPHACLLCLACLLGIAAGCQTAHRASAGEEIVAAPPTDAATAPDTVAPPAVVAAPATAEAIRPPQPVPATPLTLTHAPTLNVAADADEAARLRNWPLSTNYYATGHFIAGPTYSLLAPQPKTDRVAELYTLDILQSILTIPQFLATPFWALKTPPNTAVEYHGEQNPPSYTVDDVLPFYTTEKVPGIVQLKR